MVRYTKKRMPTMSPLKRLSRPATPPPPFQFTDRDEWIVETVARLRFANVPQIARIVGGSEQNVGRRAYLLFRSRYLDRPKNQKVDLTTFDGSPPLVYGLGRKGATLLTQRGLPFSDKLDWTAKNKKAKAPFLAHTLAVAETMLSFGTACREQDALHLIDHHDLLPYLPDRTRNSDDPFYIRVTIHPRDLPKDLKLKEPLDIGVVPDRLFSFHHDDDTRQNFALEFDTGKMDIRSKRVVGKSSFRRKLLGYYHAWKQGLHTKVWGFQSFRVLTITPSEVRINHMINAQREITTNTAEGLFLYTTPERLAERGPLGDVWISSKRDGIYLLDRK
jgi:hypothetical protein